MVLGKKNLEQHCPDMSATQNSTELDKVTPTYGGKCYSLTIITIPILLTIGYSNFITVKEHFVCKIPKDLPLDAAAPLLCAGITTYSPLRRYNVGKDTRMGYLFNTNVNPIDTQYNILELLVLVVLVIWQLNLVQLWVLMLVLFQHQNLNEMMQQNLVPKHLLFQRIKKK